MWGIVQSALKNKSFFVAPYCSDSQASGPISVCDTRVCVFSRSLDRLYGNKSGLRWFLPPKTNRHFWLRTRFAVSHQFK